MRDKKLKRDFAPVGQQASTAPVAVLVQSTTSGGMDGGVAAVSIHLFLGIF